MAWAQILVLSLAKLCDNGQISDFGLVCTSLRLSLTNYEMVVIIVPRFIVKI